MRLDWTTTSLRGSLLLLISLVFDRIKLHISYLMQIFQAILVLRSAYSPKQCFCLSESLQLGKVPQNLSHLVKPRIVCGTTEKRGEWNQ